MTPLPEFDLLAGSNLANPLQREPGFFTGIKIQVIEDLHAALLQRAIF